MESLLIWGIVLLAAGLVVVFVEVFVPSGGLLSLVAGALGVSGLICLYLHDVVWGMVGTGLAAVLVPAVVAFGFNLMPSTAMGRKLLYGESGKPEPVIPDNQPNPYAALLNAEGEALTDLRPVGTIRVNGEKHEALSETSYIRAGVKVRVTSVEGSQIKVRPIA
ncbi:MAG: NfeD family protein [Phycisphaerales bacterium]|nr:NfeD family protein [Phycisphaerales bacterium]